MNRILLLLLISTISKTVILSQDWEKELENEKITVFTKKGEEDNIKAYKAYSFINHPIDDIYKVYVDFDNYYKWFEELEQVKLLSSERNDSTDRFLYYSVVEFPWLFENRDMFTELTITKSPDVKYTLVSKPVKDSVKYEDYVRLENFYQHTELIKENDNRTKIIMEGKYDAGGNVPAWLMNMFVVESPLNSVVNIENYLTQLKK